MGYADVVGIAPDEWLSVAIVNDAQVILRHFIQKNPDAQPFKLPWHKAELFKCFEVLIAKADP